VLDESILTIPITNKNNLTKIFIFKEFLSDDQIISFSNNISLYSGLIEGFRSIEEQSRIIDEILGYRILEIESNLATKAKILGTNENNRSIGELIHGKETWVGLDPQVLQTPYLFFFDVLQRLNLPKNSKIVDIGSGYGRFGFVLRAVRPDIIFKGFELVKERAEEGRRVLSKLKCQNSHIFQTDVTEDSFLFENADAFFCYDFSSAKNIELVLNKLFITCKSKKIPIIARGLQINHLIKNKHSWLVIKFKVSDNFIIYESNAGSK